MEYGSSPLMSVSCFLFCVRTGVPESRGSPDLPQSVGLCCTVHSKTSYSCHKVLVVPRTLRPLTKGLVHRPLGLKFHTRSKRVFTFLPLSRVVSLVLFSIPYVFPFSEIPCF